ncbi:hypothetical protein BDV12DRAFT_203808 [Aspergillus spectabilis]
MTAVEFAQAQVEQALASDQVYKQESTFIVDYGFGDYRIIWPSTATNVSQLDHDKVYPNIWLVADSLAKSAYLTVLTDLGQTADSENFLTNTDDLQFFSANFSEGPPQMVNALPGPVGAMDYNMGKDQTRSLGTNASVISMQYICQVPQLKLTGNLIMSVLVADLVLLQTAWVLFKLVTDIYLFRIRPEVNRCRHENEYLQLVSAQPGDTGSQSAKPGTGYSQLGTDQAG